jgi:hypothetical protein
MRIEGINSLLFKVVEGKFPKFALQDLTKLQMEARQARGKFATEKNKIPPAEVIE